MTPAVQPAWADVGPPEAVLELPAACGWAALCGLRRREDATTLLLPAAHHAAHIPLPCALPGSKCG